MGVTTAWGLCLFQVGPFCLTLEVANRDICFLDRNRLEPEEFTMANNVKSVIFSYTYGAKFQNTALIFPEISFIQFFTNNN